MEHRSTLHRIAAGAGIVGATVAALVATSLPASAGGGPTGPYVYLSGARVGSLSAISTTCSKDTPIQVDANGSLAGRSYSVLALPTGSTETLVVSNGHTTWSSATTTGFVIADSEVHIKASLSSVTGGPTLQVLADLPCKK